MKRLLTLLLIMGTMFTSVSYAEKSGRTQDDIVKDVGWTVADAALQTFNETVFEINQVTNDISVPVRTDVGEILLVPVHRTKKLIISHNRQLNRRNKQVYGKCKANKDKITTAMYRQTRTGLSEKNKIIFDFRQEKEATDETDLT